MRLTSPFAIIESRGKQMRRLYDDRSFGADLGARDKKDIIHRLDPETAGRKMLQRLAKIEI